MRRRLSQALPPLLAVTLAVHAGCGKRADPLPPYLKTPNPPSALTVAQVGEKIEIQIVSPSTTTQNRPLPVIELEWLQAPATGRFDKTALSLLREEVAPGEVRTKTFPRPLTDVRFSVRAFSGKARSALVTPFLFKAAPVPRTPTGLVAVNKPTGVELRWTNPPGAEPWPTATPLQSPSLPAGSSPPVGSPTNPPSPGEVPPVTPVPAPPPASTSPAPTPPPASSSPSPPATPAASPTSTPVPTPPPAPPTGIRIYRTDSDPRLAREPLQESTWLDSTVKPGERPCYAVAYATSHTPVVESSPSDSICIEVLDLVPPDPPARLLGDMGPNFVELSWTASPSSDTVSYRLYRSFPGGARTLVIETTGLILRVQDSDLTRGERAYEVVAVDKGGNESLPGPLLSITVP